MKALFLALSMMFLISCASSDSETKHTIVIKGINDGNDPNLFFVKIYGLYAGPDCNNLKQFRRFGDNGKFFEFFKNNKAVIASSRPTDGGVFGCVAMEISTRFRAACGGSDVANDLDASYSGNPPTGPDGQRKVTLSIPTALDTNNPHDFYFVAKNINNCAAVDVDTNFELTETNPLP